MTDAPIPQPPSRLERIKSFIADLARPFSIYAASLSGAWATVVIASKVTTAEGGAIVLGVLAGWGTALYAGKAMEVTRISGHAAEVEKVRAAQSPPPAAAPVPADAVAAPADDGELPAADRVYP